MFWEKFWNLCAENGETPSSVAKAIGVSPAATTKWKQGALPSAEVLLNIATHFNVSTDELLGHQVYVAEHGTVLARPAQRKPLTRMYGYSPKVRRNKPAARRVGSPASRRRRILANTSKKD